MPQKTSHIRTAFILFPGHLKSPYSFLVKWPDEKVITARKKGNKTRLNTPVQCSSTFFVTVHP